MNRRAEILAAVAAGRLAPDEAELALSALEQPVAELGFATLDLDRHRRQGFPEVVFGLGKTAEEVALLLTRLAEGAPNVLATRAPAAAADLLPKDQPWVYHPRSGALALHRDPAPRTTRRLGIVSAGTSDAAVAEEAEVTARLMGIPTERLDDVGVAGLHRVLRRLGALRGLDALIVVAGLEAALPSVLAGLVAAPVIAVPTSVGYGTSFQGVTALLGALNACASGVTVVNIDNGFGAAYAVGRWWR
jgi:hypothetical protein